jgi:hypothetical protein
MHAKTYRRALALLLSVLVTLTATTVVATPAHAAPTCSATYRVSSSWPTGFSGEFTLSVSPGTETKGWRVEVHFQTGVEVTSNWNSEKLLDADPVYVFGNASWNFEIISGSTRFGVWARRASSSVPTTPRNVACAPIL